MIYGQELKRAIEEMGLNPRSFAAKCVRKDGRALSRTAIDDFIRRDGIQATPEVAWAVEAALAKRCRCCGQYTEKEDAWNHKSANPESGGRKRKS